MKKKRSVMIVLSVVLFLAMTSCASMDMRVDKIEYNCCYEKRILLKQVKALEKEPGRDFMKVADYLVSEAEEILIPRSMQEVKDWAMEIAWKDGCEAVYIRDYGTTNVSYQKKRGAVVRDRPYVKFTGYRVILPQK